MKLMSDQGSLIRQGENEAINTGPVDSTTNASSFYAISPSPTSAAAAAAAATSIGFYTHSPNLTLNATSAALFSSPPGHSAIASAVAAHQAQSSQPLPAVASFYTSNRADVSAFIHSSGESAFAYCVFSSSRITGRPNMPPG